MENDGITFPSSEKFQVSPRQPLLGLGGLDSPPQSVMNPFMLLFSELVGGRVKIVAAAPPRPRPNGIGNRYQPNTASYRSLDGIAMPRHTWLHVHVPIWYFSCSRFLLQGWTKKTALGLVNFSCSCSYRICLNFP